MAAFPTILMFLLAIAAGCGSLPATELPTPSDGSTPVSPRPETLGLERVVSNNILGVLEFGTPTNFVQASDGWVLVSDQPGQIVAISDPIPRNAGKTNSVNEILDIRDRVSSRGWEEGLLGLAIDPNDPSYFYVYYSAARPRRSVVSRFFYSGSGDAAAADPDSELVILEVEQPYANHNGGQLAFGPDGYLYIGLGDGGSAGDPRGNGQDTSTLLGTILRIDVSEATAEQPYAVPPDNPFADDGGRAEIWAYGLRNPWRFSFDRGTGDRDTGELWAGDVGQNEWEEIDIIERGGNYGWNVLEGTHCFSPSSDCEREGMIPPVWEYSLDGEACSVIGGFVYRGSGISWLSGVYVYGDFCTGEIFGLRRDGGDVINQLLADTDHRIASFGEDGDGELYVLTQGEGILRLVESQ